MMNGKMNARVAEVMAYFEQKRDQEDRESELEEWHAELARHWEDLREIYASHGLDDLIGMEP